ncbi:MAG: hypothetical protein AAF215_11980 [Cyanobacteria bacterium P01_A01_bin.123]
MMNTALTEGLEVVGVISVAASILIPVFCWVLISRVDLSKPKNV